MLEMVELKCDIFSSCVLDYDNWMMGEVKINLDTTPQDDSVKKQISTQKPKDETKVKDKQDVSRKPNEDKEYISSLFNHNPEIPTIEQSEFEPTKEDVFSVKTFDNLNLNPHLVKNLSELGLTTLTTIQSKALPVIMGGKDALIKSQTGSGKTMTYAIPIMQKLGSCEPRIDRKSGCFALVIVPTRELAVQSYEWFQKLCKAFIWVVPCLLVGGENRKAEKVRLRKGVNIIISTPGRMVDHLEKTENFKLDKVEWVVLDEADRMLELGYEREVQKVLTALQLHNNLKRQSLLLSATLTTGIQQLSEVSLRHPVFIDAAVSTDDTAADVKDLVTPENLNQTFLLVPAKLRLVALGAFVLWKCQQSKNKKMLIFFPTQDMVDFYIKYLEIILWGEKEKSSSESILESGEEITSDAKKLLGEQSKLFDPKPNLSSTHSGLNSSVKLLKLHGNMKQNERLSVFQDFRKSPAGVLLCTDVAARGLDLPQVDWIVQYTPPVSVADYVHRVGRTARIGARGSSVIFLLPSEAEFVKMLEGSKIPLAEMTLELVLSKLLRSGITGSQGRRPASVEEAATNLQMRMESAVVKSPELHQAACQAYVSFVRSYASYPREARNVFCFKDLHLGHCAKSFALRDPPSKITGIGKGNRADKGNWVEKQEKRSKDLKREEKIIKAQKRRIDQKSLIMSEYSSGLETKKMKKGK